jgi:hypothetical protein
MTDEQNSAVEAVDSAALTASKAIYGDSFDPKIHVGQFDMMRRAARAILASLPAANEPLSDAQQLPAASEGEAEHRLRMIVSHATGGNLQYDPAMSVNAICVQISAMRNKVWEHAREALRKELPAPSDQEKLAAINRELVEALAALEVANDDLTSKRSQATYDSMIEDGCSTYLNALDTARRDARALITRARQTTPAVSGEGWRPIETAPKDGWHAPILTCCIGDPVAWFGHEPVAGFAQPPSTAYWNEHGDCWTPCQRPHDVWEPTHWMPLLAPPGNGGDQIGREP